MEPQEVNERLGYLEAEVAQAHKLLDAQGVRAGCLPERILELHALSLVAGLREAATALRRDDDPEKS